MSCAATAVAVIAALSGTVVQAHAQARATTPTASCTEADTLSNAGKLTAAHAADEKLDPATPCVATGIAVVQFCEQGQVELQAGRSTQAATDFDNALEKNPEATCASKGLDALKSSAFSSWVTNAINIIEDGLTLAGIVVAFGFALLLLGWFAPVQHLFLGIPYIRYFVAPRLSFNAFDDSGGSKCAAPLSARIGEEILRSRDKALS